MWYHILPNILLLFAILGMIILVLRRLPEAVEMEAKEEKKTAEERLQQKGVPIMVLSNARAFVVFWLKRFWQFLLEAKDIRHSPVINYRIKRILKEKKSDPMPPGVLNPAHAPASVLRNRHTPVAVPVEEQILLESQDEVYYLERIKKEPKNLQRYSALGNFYLHTKNFSDAQSMYEYLVKYDPGNSGYYAKLAYVRLARGQYLEAAADYHRAIALDPGHPSRYYNLGLAYKSLGKWKESHDMFEKACEFEPTNVKYRSMKDYAASQIAS